MTARQMECKPELVAGAARLALLGLIVLVLLGSGGCDAFRSSSAGDALEAAREHLERNDAASAVIEIKNALQQAPDNAAARALLGQIYAEQGQGQAAEKELRRALDLGVPKSELRVPLAQALLTQGRHQQLLREVPLPPESAAGPTERARLLVLRGHALRGLRLEREGCERFRQAAEVDADAHPPVLAMALCDFAAGRFDAARDRLTALLERAPEELRARLLLAEVEATAGRLEAAREAYRQALQSQPGNLTARLGLAVMALQADDQPAARQVTGSLLKSTPGDPRVRYLRGLVEYRDGALQEAEVQFQAALAAEPAFLPARLWLGLSQYLTGNPEQANVNLAAFLEQQPGHAGVRFLLGLAQARLARDDRALARLAARSGLVLDDPEVLADLVTIGRVSIEARQGFVMPVGDGPAVASPRLARLLEAALREPGLPVGSEGDPGSEGAMPKALADGLARLRVLAGQGELKELRREAGRLAEAFPDSALPHAALGAAELQARRPEPALAAFSAALRRDPDHLGALRGEATALLALGRNDEAKDALMRLQAAAPEDRTALLGLAQLATAAGDQAGAERWLRRASQVHPADPDVARVWGTHLLQGKRPAQAEKAVQAALAAYPESAALREVEAFALLGQRRFADAAEAFRRLRQLRPEDAQYALNEVNALRLSGNREAALEAGRQAAGAFPGNEQLQLVAGQMELAAGNAEEALAVAEALTEGSPEQPQGHLLRAAALAQEGRMAQALEASARARALAPESRQAAAAHANLLWQAGRQIDSLDALQAWVEAHPDDLALRRTLGDRSYVAGQLARAEGQYRAILREQPDAPQVLNNLANLRIDDDPAEAVELARRANALVPDEPRLKDTLGWALVQSGQLQEGARLLEEAATALPDDPTVQYHHAAALARTGEPAAARRRLASLLQDAGEFPEREAARALLQRFEAEE